MIEAGLLNLLTTTEAIKALVADRIYPGRIPERGRRPCIVYSLSNTEYGDGLDDTGDTAEQTGPDTAHFRIECWGEGPDGYKQAAQVAYAVRDLWRTQKGLLGVNSTLRSKYSWIEDVRDEEFEQTDGMDSKRFLRVVDIAVEYDPAQV